MEGADPITIWYDLGQNPASEWAWAETFRRHLEVPLARLIPEQLATLREPIGLDAWTTVRRSSARQLATLIVEYRLAVSTI